MEIRPIKNEKDYNDSIRRIEELWGAKKDSQQGDELDLLVTLVESYEMKHYPIAPPDPVDAIKFRMEQMGMTRADLDRAAKSNEDYKSGKFKIFSATRQPSLLIAHYSSLTADLKVGSLRSLATKSRLFTGMAKSSWQCLITHNKSCKY